MTLDELHNARGQAKEGLGFLKIFPLPRAVLLPGSVVPLHIFEPRYRRMIADCLTSDRILALANIISGRESHTQPAVEPIVGVGRIVFDQRLDDGRSIIMLQGLLRAEIDHEHELELPYRVASATELVDHHPADDGGHVATLRHLLGQLSRRLKPDSGAGELVRMVAAESDPGLLADIVGGALFDDTKTRLQLMSLRAPLQRLELVNRLLASALSRVPPRPSSTEQLC